MELKNKHGGSRPGSGRPPKKYPYKEAFTIRLQEGHMDKLKSISNEEKGVAVVAREILIEALDKMVIHKDN